MDKQLTIPLSEWVSAACESLEEVSQATLGFDDFARVETHAGRPPNMAAGYVGLVSDANALQIAVGAELAHCRALAAVLLGMEPEEAEDLGEGDVGDAMGEMINVVAGGVKKRLAERDGGLKLGLPLFLLGRAEPSQHIDAQYSVVQTGGITIYVAVFGGEVATAADAAA
jgi:CheY-specific phosphatase CheX